MDRREYQRVKQRHANMTAAQIEHRREYQRLWLKNRTPEQIESKKNYNRKYFKDMSSEKIRSRFLKACYGITLEEWERIFILQRKKCAICKTKDPGKHSWHTDHDHKTQKVRGILCHHCNTLLGLSRENVRVLKSAIDYLGER